MSFNEFSEEDFELNFEDSKPAKGKRFLAVDDTGISNKDRKTYKFGNWKEERIGESVEDRINPLLEAQQKQEEKIKKNNKIKTVIAKVATIPIFLVFGYFSLDAVVMLFAKIAEGGF